MTDGKRVGVRELAAELGASPAAIVKATKAGRLAPVEQGPRGPLYDLEACRKAWESTKNRRKLQARGGGRPGRVKPSPAPSLSESTDLAPEVSDELARQVASVLADPGDGLSDDARLLRAQAARAVEEAAISALKRRKLEGDLVDVASVQKIGGDLGALLYSRLYGMSSKRSKEFAGLTDDRDIQDAWDGDIDKLFREIRKTLNLTEEEQ